MVYDVETVMNIWQSWTNSAALKHVRTFTGDSRNGPVWLLLSTPFPAEAIIIIIFINCPVQ